MESMGELRWFSFLSCREAGTLAGMGQVSEPVATGTAGKPVASPGLHVRFGNLTHGRPRP